MEAERLCPYPGLRPFRANETDIFFGRETLVTDLIKKLGDHRFVAVVGTSGCGKSSLVRTGMIGALETGLLAKTGARWRVADMRPGGDPLTRLAVALSKPFALGKERGADVDNDLAVGMLRAELRRGPRALDEILQDTPLPPETNLLILVDQFEEIFRYRKEGDIADADAFVSLLLEATRAAVPVYVVITMRSDFLGDCALFEGLPEALNRGQFLVPRLTREQRRTAIERPAQVFGGDVEPGLVNRLLNDMETMRLQVERSPEGGPVPDQLPLMQHVLMRVWQRVDERVQADPAQPQVLTLDDYHAVGGLHNALSNHADEALASLEDSKQREIARIMFRLLTERGQDRRDIRRPTRYRRVCGAVKAEPAEVNPVIEAFRRPDRSFLTPPAGIDLQDDTVLDISHESLISQWETLDVWADAEARAAEIYRDLLQRARRWEQEQEELLRGTALRRAHEWRKDHAHNAAWAEQYGGGHELVTRFIRASERRTGLRYAAIAASAALFVAVAGTLAYVQLKADAEKAELQQEALLRTAGYELKDDRALALLLGAEAHAMAHSARSREFLAEALGKELVERKLPTFSEEAAVGHTSSVVSLSLDRTGTRLISAGSDRRVIKWDLHSRNAQSEPLADARPMVTQVATLSADGELLATERTKGGIELWNLATGQSLGPLADGGGHRSSVTSVAISPDGQLLATGSRDNTVIIWDAVSGRPKFEPLRAHSGDILGVAFSPDGRLLASASTDNSVILWQVDSGAKLGGPLRAHRGDVSAVAFSPDGKLLATGSKDDSVMLWDVANRKPFGKPLRGHTGDVTSIAFSKDGRALASGSRDRTVRLWTLSQRAPRSTRLEGHRGDVTSVAFSRDGRTLASGGKDNVVIVWNHRQARQIRRLSHPRDVEAVVFGQHGRTLVSNDSLGTVRLWDARTGRLRTTTEPLDGRGKGLSVAVAPARLAAATDKRVVVLDISRARLDQSIATIAARVPKVTAIALGPGNRAIATGTSEGSITVWDAETRTRQLELTGHRSRVTSLAFGPNGRRLASGSSDSSIILWDTEGGKRITGGSEERSGKDEALSEHGGSVRRLAFSPDGRTLASGSSDDRVLLWDVATGKPRLAPQKDPKSSDPTKKHRGDVLALAFSPDGALLASGSQDDTIVLWDVETGVSFESPLKGHAGDVTELLFHPDGHVLYSAGRDKKINVWRLTEHARAASDAAARQEPRAVGASAEADVDSSTRQLATLDGLPLAAHQGSPVSVSFDRTGRDILRLSADGVMRQPTTASALAGHSRPVFDVAFSPDGKWLASGARDKSIIVWNVASRKADGKPLTLDIPGRPAKKQDVYGLAFSPDGKVLASGTQDNLVVLWDLEARKPLFAPLKGHKNLVVRVAFSPDGKTVASASFDGTVWLWDAEKGVPNRKLVARGRVWDVAFSPQGNVLAWAGADDRVTLWDVAAGEKIRDLVGHTQDVLSIDYAPSGKLLASASKDRTVRIWDPTTGKPVATLEGHKNPVYSVAFSADGRRLASADNRGTILFWDAQTHQQLGQLGSGGPAHVFGLAFSPKGGVLASTNWKRNTVQLLDRKVIESLRSASQATGAGSEMRHLAISTDGKLLVVATNDSDVLVIDAASGVPVNTLAVKHAKPARVAAISADGRLIATGADDAVVRVWEATSAQPEVKLLLGHKGPVTSLAFAPDSQTLASGGEDRTAILWDSATGKPLHLPLVRHGGAVTSVAYSPSGEWLATGSTDRIVRILGLDAERPQARQLRGHHNWVTSLAFRDETTLISGGLDHKVLVWDLPTRSPIARLAQHKDAVSSIAVSPDGNRLASASLDGTILIWDVDATSWMERACNVAGRILTQEEKESFLHDADHADICSRIANSDE